MREFLIVFLLAGLVACKGSGNVEAEIGTLKNEADTMVNKIENSEVADSIKSKGGRLLDSTKAKGGRVINKLEDKFNDIKNKKDSTK
jgi:hypothetical protein